MSFKIIHYSDDYEDEVAQMVAHFRQTLANFKGKEKELDIVDAFEELNYYLKKEYPIFLAISKKEKVVGYIVAKIIDNVIWAESLYVDDDFRRKGIATALYRKLEQKAQAFDQDTVYNWVHPNNQKIISFLRKQGYTVLNLLEIRKPHHEEKLDKQVQIKVNDKKEVFEY